MVTADQLFSLNNLLLWHIFSQERDDSKGFGRVIIGVSGVHSGSGTADINVRKQGAIVLYVPGEWDINCHATMLGPIVGPEVLLIENKARGHLLRGEGR